MVDPIPPSGGAWQAGPAHAASRPSDLKLHHAAQAFESLFWEEVIRAGLPSGFVSGEAGDSLYGGMIETGLADAVARAGGTGLAKLLEHFLTKR